MYHHMITCYWISGVCWSLARHGDAAIVLSYYILHVDLDQLVSSLATESTESTYSDREMPYVRNGTYFPCDDVIYPGCHNHLVNGVRDFDGGWVHA